MSRTRGAWNTKITWVAGVALAGVLLLSGYALIGGDEQDQRSPAAGASPAPAGSADAASPLPTYVPPKDWTEPQRWVALPRGQRTDERANPVGFPHTTEGAVAMMVASSNLSLGEGKTNADEKVRQFTSYAGKAERTPGNLEKVRLKAAEADAALAKEMGAPAGGPLPQGAYLRVHVVGFKVIKKSDDEVSVWVLTRAMQKNGEMAKESGGYAVSLVAAQWQDGDWKQTMDASLRAQTDSEGQAQPEPVAPGDEAFNASGWTALREAS